MGPLTAGRRHEPGVQGVHREVDQRIRQPALPIPLVIGA